MVVAVTVVADAAGVVEEAVVIAGVMVEDVVIEGFLEESVITV